MYDPVAIVVIVLIVAAVYSVFHLVKSKHLEQMAKIESGMMDNEINDRSNLNLNVGILLCSLALGVFTSYVFSTYTSIPKYVCIPGFLLLFGGIGFIVSYTLGKKNVN